ncbi:hypothetical protein G3545_14085 [Starkeya sp. ORNL1]|uniref:phage tail length tape measure family protein n=1 Tax=Starkeya sp. ORNL1 TaxID=2709380 RepID=UPI0014645F90|nr:phage tail length tape measure family protein [Starkeya sp. ORNL1]QJP14673.1 hypothetical protein G3545_14085 [Starkeya sp. ORNL1]
MADRNVNVRLQVIDGGKVRAELNAVGNEGAVALDKLSARSQQAAASVNKLATHEVGNLAAQLSDIGVSLASGQSPFTVLIQQGAQISQIMGDRGVKGIIGAVGQGLLSLINPTTLALGGLAAAGYVASFALDALSGDTEDLNGALDESKQLTDDLKASMDSAGKGAENFAQEIREVASLQATENLRKLTVAYDNWSAKFAAGFNTSSLDPLGNVTGGDELNQRFAPFEDAIRRFQESVAAGRPDVTAFARDVAEIGNATPSLRDMSTELIKAAERGGEFHRAMDIAAARTAYLAGTASDAQLALLGLSNTMKGISDSINVLREIENSLKLAGDERSKFIEGFAARGQGGPDWLTEAIRKSAGALFDQNKQLEENKKKAQEADRAQEQYARRLESDGQRVYRETRTAAENYADEISRLNELLGKGKITQDTYSRAVANAGDEMDKASRQALDKATDAGSGFTRAFDDYLKSAQDMATATENLTTDVLDGIGDAFARFATTGKLSFSDLTNSIIADLTKLATQRLLSMLLGSLFPGAGGAAVGVVGGAGPMVVPTFRHSGGLVGAGGGNRGAFPAEMFLNAQRFHSGGGFLAPDERPAILQVGERVLSRAEVAGGSRRPTVVNKITNYLGADVQARDGGEDSDGNQVNEVIIGTVQQAMGQGKFNPTMRGSFAVGNRRIIRGA